MDESDSSTAGYRPAKRQKTNYSSDLSALQHESYTVAWICALPIEMAAALIMLDEKHTPLPTRPGDNNTYKLGRIKQHNVVIACLPSDQYGNVNAANVVTNLTGTFPSIRAGLMVGIGGGVPSKANDIRLGDVVVGSRVVQYDLGKTVGDGELQTTASPRFPHQLLSTAVSALRSEHERGPSQICHILTQRLENDPSFRRPKLPDRLFYTNYDHELADQDCDQCDQSNLTPRGKRVSSEIVIHYGPIASANQVMKSGTTRDNLARQLKVICFEMEAAGLMDTLPCLIIRGICDYSDSHKSKGWQRYAAATAAAYARELLGELPITEYEYNRKPASNLEYNSAHDGSHDHREGLLDSLKFDQIASRKLNIKAAHAKTCRWFLKHPDYQAWLDPTRLVHHHGFIWVSGKPGAGKSTIMKFACLDMQKKVQKCQKRSLVVSFFFNARGEYLERSILGMYRSSLFQLLQGYPDLQSVLDDSDVISHGCTSLNVLKDLFSTAVLRLGEKSLTCFVDALDECDEQQVVDLVQYFEDLAEQCVSENISFKVCFSSRHYPYITIKQGIRLTLEDQMGHSQDLETYITSRLQIQDSALNTELRPQLLEKAAGVFMWVVLVVDILNKEYRRGGLYLRKRLNEIPSDLSELFKDILRRDNENMEELLLCILWVLYAKRSLQPKEFYHALWSGLALKGLVDDNPVIFSDPDSSDSMNRFTRCVISSSKGLAEVTKSSTPIVQFIHESVRDFLIKDKGLYQMWPDLGLDWEDSGNEMLKRSCNVYLKHVYAHISTKRRTSPECELSKESYMNLGNAYPFSSYACQQLLYHSEGAAKSIPQCEFLNDLNESQRSRWIEVNNLFEEFKIRKYGPDASLIYILAAMGHPNLIRQWSKGDPQVHLICRKERYRYSFFAAISSGNKDAVAAILNIPSTIHNGVDIMENFHGRQNLKRYKRETPLTWAAKEGWRNIIQILLLQGVDPNEENDRKETPLFCALKHGQELATNLLEIGANPCQDSFRFVCEKGFDRLAILMISNGVEVDRSDRYLKPTPLLLASRNGHTEIVRLLIQRGATVNFYDNRGQTPLFGASFYGHKEVVELLIDNGAELSTASNRNSPLIGASERGNEAIVQLLVENGADLECRSLSSERTPLVAASGGGHEAVVRFLIEKGAAINTQNSTGDVPLHAASRGGHEAVVRFLIEKGADINAQDRFGNTPLRAASRGGHEAVVRFLIEKGADINAQNSTGDTPLHAASKCGHETVVRLLIEKGADINAQDFLEDTPLLAARRHPNIAQILINLGADVNSKDTNGQTPLSFAKMNNHHDLIRHLRDHGADEFS
ncbi:unnamed protein product [Penicillium pancosmium]